MPASLGQLLFSFRGRINRQPWWIASLLVGIGTGVLTGIIEAVARLSGNATLDPETNMAEPTGVFQLITALISLATTWVNLALCAKRLHDRDRTAWWLAVQVAVLVVAILAGIGAVVVSQADFGGGAAAIYALAGLIGLIAVVISIWLFIEIGFLRGTVGPNRFGPDPLGASKPDAAL